MPDSATNTTSNRKIKSLIITNSNLKPKNKTIIKTSKLKRLQQASKAKKKNRNNRRRPRKQNKAMKHLKPSIRTAYAMCRLMPFGSHGPSSGIPDGSETRRLLVDHRMMTSITFGSTGTMNIAITPALPSSVWVSPAAPDTTWKLNGTTMSSWPGIPSSYLPIVQPEWRNQTITYRATTNRINTVATLYNSSKYRIVSVGWALSFTGNITNNAGSVLVTSQKIALQTASQNSGIFTIANADGSSSAIDPAQVLQRGLQNFVSFGAGYNQETKMYTLAMGANGILKHSTADFKYVDLASDATYVSIPGLDQNSILIGYTNNPTTVGSSALVLGMDDDWHSTLLEIKGATTGASIMLDTIYCIEYVPAPSSDVYALAQPAPMANPATITATAAAARDLPLAKPGPPETNSHGLMDKLTDFATTTASKILESTLIS